MRLQFRDGQWHVGNIGLNCGRQVLIRLTDRHGDWFEVWGRFEIAGANNPVFYTAAGRFIPDLELCSFSTEGGR